MASSSNQSNEIEFTTRLTRYLPLYKAVLQGHLETVEKICLDLGPDALETRITANFDTALHVAVGTGTANHIVKFLLGVMFTDLSALRNNDGDTVLSIAAIVGNIEAAKMILSLWPSLNQIENQCGRIPLLEAARHGQKEMVRYLLQFSEDYLLDAEHSADKPGVFFMNSLLVAGFYDLAKDLLRRHEGLGEVELYGGDSLLSTIAGKPSAFPSGRQLNSWQRIMHRCLPVKLNFPARPTSRNKCFFPRAHEAFQAGLWRTLEVSVPKTKEIQEIKLLHHQTLELVKHLCGIAGRIDHAKASSIFGRPILLGAELGIHEIVEEIIGSFPHAVWFTDAENHNVFQLAVLYRQEKVFNLIYQMSGYKHLLLVSEDTSGNNILHLAGKLAPQHRLNLISGAALQMQRELHWFKEVEKVVQPAFKDDKNSQGKTPAMVFTEEHMKLVKEGEKWMKDTASSCTVAAALIATVVFAAAITVPGGNNNDNGHPIFDKEIAFIVFGISDALSLFSSVAAILMFLSILTARYAEADFLYALPKRLIWGLVTLFLSITSMMAAFSATIYLVFCDKKAWMLIPVAFLACLPVSLFVSLQFPLLVDMISSTYGPGIFGKQNKRMLY